MPSMRRGMLCLAGVVVWMGLLVRPARTENARAEVELVYRVQQVLQRHCLRCHGEEAKGGIRLLDRDLLVKQRQLVRPGAADASELLDLVEGGSMPPGNAPKVSREDQTLLRQWIEAGAAAIPDRRDESYVLWNIVRDRETLRDKWKPSFRYLSLNHLLAPDGTTGDLDRQRAALERVLRYLTAEDAPGLVLERIDPAGAVLRIDLQRLGWDRHPYKDTSKLNLFDLASLEYPDGRLPINSPFYADVFRFLKDAAQVRPIAYVRADWLAGAVTKAPLHADFLATLGKPTDSKPPEESKPPRAPTGAAALVLGENTDRAPQTVPRGTSSIPSRSPHREAKEGTRRTFQDHLAEAMAPGRRGGVPIVPLDGLTYPRHDADPLLAVTFKAVDFEQRMRNDPPAKDTFVMGERMALWIKTNEKVFVELVWTNNRGIKIIRIKPNQVVPSGQMTLLDAKMTLEDNEEQDREEYTLYVYRAAALEEEKASFPAGKVLHADQIHDRFLHPLLYPLDDNGGLQPPDANKMVKRTVRITTVRRGQKKN